MAGFDFDLGLENEIGKTGPIEPFWSIKMDDEERVLEWLNGELAHLKDQATERINNQQKNLATYRGIHLRSKETRDRDEAAQANSSSSKSKNPRVIYNHMVDMVEQDVARMTKYRGAISCNPGSDDNEDRITSEIAEDLIEGFWSRSDVDIDYLMQRHVRRKRILGEDFVGVFWNRNLGPYSMDWIASVFQAAGLKEDPRQMTSGQIYSALAKLRKNGGIPKLPLIDENGKQLSNSHGEKLWIDRPQRIGDIEHRLLFSWDVFGQRKDDWEQVEYVFWREYKNIETVKAQHPGKADKIEADAYASHWDGELCEEVSRKNMIEVVHLYHKSTDELDGGRYIKFVRGAVLINKDNPYVGEDYRAILPLVRTGDIDTPGVMNGDATVTHGRGPLAVYNNLISLDVRNKFLFAHPKWFMPKGAAKVESLGNNTSVVSFRGPTPPQLVQPQLSSDIAMKTEAKTDLQQIMNVYGVSRGDPPTGITAAVALTFLDEQETDRAAVGVAGVTRTLLNIAKHDLWLMADHYADEDGRLEKILGRNRAAQAESFKLADLRGIGDVRTKNASALPQQKSARLQYILDIKKEFPGIVPEDNAVDLLGLGEVDRLRSIVTVAIRAADGENQWLMMGKEPKAPEKFEFQLQHYRTHMRQMNEEAFENLPKASQQRFKDHAGAHEMFMVEIGMKNPQYLATVMQEFPGFPYFFVPESMGMALPEMLPPMDPAAGGLPPGMDPMAQPAAPGVPPGMDLTALPPEGLAPGAEATTPMQEV